MRRSRDAMNASKPVILRSVIYIRVETQIQAERNINKKPAERKNLQHLFAAKKRAYEKKNKGNDGIHNIHLIQYQKPFKLRPVLLDIRPHIRHTDAFLQAPVPSYRIRLFRFLAPVPMQDGENNGSYITNNDYPQRECQDYVKQDIGQSMPSPFFEQSIPLTAHGSPWRLPPIRIHDFFEADPLEPDQNSTAPLEQILMGNGAVVMDGECVSVASSKACGRT